MNYVLKQPEQEWMRLHLIEAGDTFLLDGNALAVNSNVYMKVDEAHLVIPRDFCAVVCFGDGKLHTLPFETKVVLVQPSTPIEFAIK